MNYLKQKLIYGNIPENASIREKKTAILGNKLILSIASFSFLFLIINEVFILFDRSERSGTYLNLTFSICYFISWLFNHRGKFKIGKTIFAVTGNIHVGVLVLSYGVATATNWFFLVSLIFPLLLFTSNDKGTIISLMGLTILVASGTELYYLEHTPLLQMSPVNEIFWYHVNVGMVFMLVGGCVYYFFRATHDAEAILEEEQKRSENLLLNILPSSIASRLKSGEGVIADQFESVSVLFTDIVGFTKFSQTVGARELVHVLNELFSRFDELSLKHNLEKIKTIGDAYMVVSGIPEPAANHAEKIAAMALDMRGVVMVWSEKLKVDLEIRIGIHSGAVVAGVIGKQKFIYDLWGDTVNTASRMESHGEPGKIQVSEDTYRLLKDKFTLRPRGEIKIKGKGLMQTYFLEERLKIR